MSDRPAGPIDGDLLDLIEARADVVGITTRAYIERTMRASVQASGLVAARGAKQVTIGVGPGTLIDIPAELFERVWQEAKAQGIPVTAFAERALSNELADADRSSLGIPTPLVPPSRPRSLAVFGGGKPAAKPNPLAPHHIQPCSCMICSPPKKAEKP